MSKVISCESGVASAAALSVASEELSAALDEEEPPEFPHPASTVPRQTRQSSAANNFVFIFSPSGKNFKKIIVDTERGFISFELRIAR